jgi:hypothetical protein
MHSLAQLHGTYSVAGQVASPSLLGGRALAAYLGRRTAPAGGFVGEDPDDSGAVLISLCRASGIAMPAARMFRMRLSRT